MKDTPNVGGTPPEDARRDAIHVAVAPVVAAVSLRRGDHVGLDDRGLAFSWASPIGIVDPFYEEEYIKEGQRFWLFLYPNTVTSLRHVWTHPAFGARPPVKGEAR